MIEYASEKYFKVLYPDIGIETNNGENGGSKDHNIERGCLAGPEILLVLLTGLGHLVR